MSPNRFALSDSTVLSDQEQARMGENLAHWEENAERFGDQHDVSWKDGHLVAMEIQNVASYLSATDTVLDVGCSNGYSTFRIYERVGCPIDAFDYSLRSVQQAQATLKTTYPGAPIRFWHGNCLEIEGESNAYPRVYTIRVLINLPSFDLQRQALHEIHRVLKPGGLYILSEAFNGSQERLNGLRRLIGLPDLQPPRFNLYFNEDELEDAVEGLFHIEEINRFSSIYYVASRFMRYMTLNRGFEDSYTNAFNDFFAQYAHQTDFSGDFGIQKIYVLRKLES